MLYIINFEYQIKSVHMLMGFEIHFVLENVYFGFYYATTFSLVNHLIGWDFNLSFMYLLIKQGKKVKEEIIFYMASIINHKVSVQMVVVVGG